MNVSTNQKPSDIEKVTFLSDEKIWFLYRERRHFGPFSIGEIQSFIQQGLVALDHYFWKPGMKEWERLDRYENFQSFRNPNVLDIRDDKFSDFINFESRIRSEFKHQTPLEFSFENGESFVSGEQRDSATTKKLYKRLLHFGFVASTVVFASFIYFFIVLDSPSRELLLLLSKDDKANLEKVVELEEDLTKPQAALAILSSTSLYPEVVFASNLKKDSELSITVRSVPGTLVSGKDQFITMLKRVTQRVDKVGPIRNEDGSSLIPGKYEIILSCLNCGDNINQIVTKDRFLLGTSASQSYYNKVNSNNGILTKKLSAEVTELKEIVFALVNQRNIAVGQLSSLNTRADFKKEMKIWDAWNVMQGSILDTFEPLKSNEFVQTLVLSSVYNSVFDIAKNLMEFGQSVVQIQSFKSGKSANSAISGLKALNKKIDEELEKIESLIVSLEKDLRDGVKYPNILDKEILNNG